MVLNGIEINTIEELELAIVEFDLDTQEYLRNEFTGNKPVINVKKFKINKSYENPENIDFDIMGFHKQRTIVKGELISTKYYSEYDGITYNDLIVEEIRTYNRNQLTGVIITRNATINWYYEDGTIGHTKTWTKYYPGDEAIQEGVDRRNNVINEAKGYLLYAVGQTYGFDFLLGVKTYIGYYQDGYRQPLIDAVNASTKPYMSTSIKAAVVNILTF